ncbi:hypothetical protein DFR74_111254 [Nocardia puris]|uniref:Uncharacterized protein n=2 Tax=Nocardia puris TaxID=208602 RepID=A0A366DBW6_9NOCA|nr:hypothetical protein DFR74_111254 [Nocardia puris]
MPRMANGVEIGPADWERVLRALFGLTPAAATDLLVTAEARLAVRSADPESRAARCRHTYERLEAGLARDGKLTGSAVDRAARVFERERELSRQRERGAA